MKTITKKIANKDGFTLLEIVVVLAMVAILAGMAAPSFNSWLKNSNYKSAALSLTSMMRHARSEAIAHIAEHRVVVNLDSNTAKVERGNLASHSSSWSKVREEKFEPRELLLASGSTCGVDSGESSITFNSKGRSDLGTICIQSTSGDTKYTVSIQSKVSGRAVLAR